MDAATEGLLTDKYQTVCRFCFRKRTIDEIFFDIFVTKVGNKTLFDCIQTNFAVLERKIYQQCLNAKRWTSEYLEVVEFAINGDDTLLRGICVKCLQVLIEIDSLASRIRLSNLEQFSQATFETKLKTCHLKAKDEVEISHDQIMRALNFEEHSHIDELANFWDTCRFCLEHKTILLFDIFTSKIGDDSIVDVIKMCTATYKQQDVHIFVHLRKSYLKTITIPDYEWPNIEENHGPRKICIQCLQPLIRFKFLTDRIRKTNAALSLVDLSCNLNGYVGINLLHTTLEKLLDKCMLKTGTGEVISTQQVLHTIKLTELSYKSLEDTTKNMMLITPYQYSADFDDSLNNVLLNNGSASTNLYTFCRLCNNFIDSDSNLDEHVLMHVQAADNCRFDNVCKTCLKLIITGDDSYYLHSNSDDWKYCSMCKLRKYLDYIDDTTATFADFIKLQFDD